MLTFEEKEIHLPKLGGSPRGVQPSHTDVEVVGGAEALYGLPFSAARRCCYV